MGKNNVIVVFAALLAAAAAAWATDLIVAPSAPAVLYAPADGYDTALELKYDTGTIRYYMMWYSGSGSWVGNDFDISALRAFRAITRVRVYSRSDWPNGRWDGFRVGIYAFAGGQPGSLLWGPTYFKPTRATAGWCNCSVNWTLPLANRRFVAAFEQYYDFPNADPFGVDNNPTFEGRSWQYTGASWQALVGSAGYRNLMLRVVVNNVAVNLAPTSVGRVKALYY
jgi:hypothetical protein